LIKNKVSYNCLEYLRFICAIKSKDSYIAWINRVKFKSSQWYTASINKGIPCNCDWSCCDWSLLRINSVRWKWLSGQRLSIMADNLR
jgi:hypothetical protein